MNTFTFVIKHKDRESPNTIRFTSTTIVTATNKLFREKRNHGAVIVDAYVGSRTAKDASRGGHMTYDYLIGRTIDVDEPERDSEPEGLAFGSLLGEVDSQCASKNS